MRKLARRDVRATALRHQSFAAVLLAYLYELLHMALRGQVCGGGQGLSTRALQCRSSSHNTSTYLSAVGADALELCTTMLLAFCALTIAASSLAAAVSANSEAADI